MATQKQIEANRRNAQRSTGPKTPQGKATVSRNAQKHGLASRLVVFPEENRTRFLELLAGFRSELRPATAFEESLVFQLAAADWRLRRIVRFETGLLTDRLHALREDLQIDPSTPRADESDADRQYHQDTRLLAQAFCGDAEADTFLKLLRYENSARRAFYKALHQLRFVQSLPAPAASPDSPLPGRRWAPGTLKVTEQTQFVPRPGPHRLLLRPAGPPGRCVPAPVSGTTRPATRIH